MSKTVKDVIEERGYGDYTINVSEIVDLFTNHIRNLVKDKNYKYLLPYNK